MRKLRNRIKFLVKLKLVGFARSFLLFLRGVKTNKDGWENRMLVINTDALGDLTMFTSTLKHYKNYFPGKKIYFLACAVFGVSKDTFGDFADELVILDHKKFGLNPFYACRFINDLRRVGFRTVVNHTPNAAEIPSKLLAVNLGAEEVIGYEGPGAQLRMPMDASETEGIRWTKKNILPRYTKVVSSIDRGGPLPERPKHYINHQGAIFRAVSGRVPDELSTYLPVNEDARREVLGILRKNGFEPGKFCVVTLGASSLQRRWSAENFAEVAKELDKRGIPVVLGGVRNELPLAGRFEKEFGGKIVNLIGTLTLPQFIALIGDSMFVFTNDTSPVHIAIALRKPSLCVVGGAHLGMLSLYGYEGLNIWVYDKNVKCLFDNWRCCFTVPENRPAPCIASITVQMAKDKLLKLLDTIKDPQAVARLSRRELFQTEFKEL